MIILGIDPGYGRLGWSILDGTSARQSIVDYGCIETKSTLSFDKRLIQIHEELMKILKKYKPENVAVESLFYTNNAKTVIQVAEARGVVLLTCSLLKIPVYNYSPLQIKSSVAGYGKADKKQVQTMVKTLLNLDSIPKPDDAADAVAVALTHVFMPK